MFVVDSLLCFGGKTWYNAVRSSALMSVSGVRAISIYENSWGGTPRNSW